MKYYINIAFAENGKSYFFSTEDSTLCVGDAVVVETTVGVEIGRLTTAPRVFETLKTGFQVKPILRRATEKDLEAEKRNLEDAKKAKSVFEDYVKELKLEMNLVDVQYTLDKAKVLFTYVANGRVDFRQLLKYLASDLHCRIELKQINPRERAQTIGGIGVCGLPLCCTTFFKEFDGVSLNLAKNQMLAINIPKISGQCGKLMCCLQYEDEAYTEAKKAFPKMGTNITYQGNNYRVNGFNILSKTVKLQNPDNIEIITLEEYNKLNNRNNNNYNKNYNNNNHK